MVSSGQRQNQEGLVSLCLEPAGEHGWKTQLSVRLGAGREVRAFLPALPLGAERAALLSAALGGGCIDQGQRSCVIKGGPGALLNSTDTDSLVLTCCPKNNITNFFQTAEFTHITGLEHPLALPLQPAFCVCCIFLVSEKPPFCLSGGEKALF